MQITGKDKELESLEIVATTETEQEVIQKLKKIKRAQFLDDDRAIYTYIDGTQDIFLTAEVLIGFTRGQNRVLYDVIDFTPTTFTLRQNKRYNPARTNDLKNQAPSAIGIIPNVSIFDKSENVNQNNEESLSLRTRTARQRRERLTPRCLRFFTK